VEIGGWRTFTTRIPPPFMLQELVHRNASAVLFTATQAPAVTLEKLEVKDLGGLTRIRVRASNAKSAIPTVSGRALRHKLVLQDRMKIEGKGIEVVSGGIVQDPVMNRVNFVEKRPWMILTHVPSFGNRDVQWIVRGKGKVTVTFESLKAKDQTLEFEL